uniref:Uncharacterized protein n=1 Tax=Arundo donax TaxID=35708 RepID=A0A0A8Y0Q3_ARUDO
MIHLRYHIYSGLLLGSLIRGDTACSCT